MAHAWLAGAQAAARRPTLWACLAYLGITLAMTWPLARGLARDLPQDLADPVLNCWILSWASDRLRLALSGDFAALAGFWNANIFHPEPRTLAYSEHLLAQSLQILPLRWMGAGLVLCYNLLFLESFVLSAIGMYLLARDLTGSRTAAFAAGLLFGFAPYRADQFAHVQVLTSQWMPFALLGLRRYVNSGRVRPLVGATAALVAQALSCGYHLLFFTPFAVAWGFHQMLAGRRWRDARRWRGLLIAAFLMALLVVPLLSPYLEVRRAGTIFRGASEVDQFSADVYAYLSAPETLRFWGEHLRLHPGPESSLFPGAVAVLLAAIGLGSVLRCALRAAPQDGHRSAKGAVVRHGIAWVAGSVLVLHLGALALLLLGAGIWPEGIAVLHIRNGQRLLTIAAFAGGALLVASSRARAFTVALARSTEGFAAAALLLASWLSLGPHVRTMGREIPGLGLYGWLYGHVPGFDGLRVPARFATVVTLFLAILGGYGARALARRFGAVPIACLATAFLLESTAAPITLNDVWSEGTLARPPDRVLLGRELPPVYHEAMRLPRGSVLLEFPFGSYPYELRYMLASTEHHRPLVNGFSGALPASYLELREALRSVLKEPDPAWEALRATTATHVVVHEQAFKGHRGPRVTAWLEQHGARTLARRGSDVLLQLRQ